MTLKKKVLKSDSHLIACSIWGATTNFTDTDDIIRIKSCGVEKYYNFMSKIDEFIEFAQRLALSKCLNLI